MVKDGAAPVRMKALPRVSVLEKVRAVKIRKAVLIRREMRRHPVENDTDIVLVENIDHRHKLRRPAESARRSKIPQSLIAP